VYFDLILPSGYWISSGSLHSADCHSAMMKLDLCFKDQTRVVLEEIISVSSSTVLEFLGGALRSTTVATPLLSTFREESAVDCCQDQQWDTWNIILPFHHLCVGSGGCAPNMAF
jgi:hypothetical protein